MKKIDLLRGLTDLDDRLIEEANPYTEDASAEVGGNDKSARRLTKLRVLSGIAAAVVIVVVGFVAAKNGWFKKMIPSHKGPAPVATPTLAPTTPTPTAVMGKDNTTPTPTITPREDPEPTPMGLREKVIPENARELTLSEVEQSDWYQCIPENTFLFYNIVNAYTYEDESGPCVLVRLIGVGYHQANGWRITQNGVGINWDLAEEDKVYEYDAEVYLTIRNVKDVPQYNLRKVSASETERYDISRYEWPLDESIPEELRLTLEQPVMDASEVSEEVLKLRTRAVKDCFPRKMVVTLGVVSGDYLLDYDYWGIEFAEALGALGDRDGWYNYSYGRFTRNPDGTWPIYYPGWCTDTESYEIEYGLTH